MKKYFPLLLTSVWLMAVSVGVGALWAYDYTPGGDTSVLSSWPLQSGIPHDPSQPTLIMFAHPKCPCTRASIGELMTLMTHCQNQVKVCVAFFRPKGSGEDWLNTDLWRSAEAIPGVVVRVDEEGNEARCFHVTTSGHVVLYDAHGKLLFSGGITSSRGHSGDNAGYSAIMQLLHRGLAAKTETPVFGCSLLDPKEECNSKEILLTR
jgi:hypothetical protein